MANTYARRFHRVWFALLAACSSPAGAPTDGAEPDGPAVSVDAALSTPLPLGTARRVSRACQQQNSGSGCFVVAVSCPGIAEREVELKVSEPAASVSPRGTIFMGSGSSGVGFYLGQESTGESVRTQLTALGFRLIERAWPGPDGWFGDNALGLKVNACRGATLLTWLRDNELRGPAFCATGNSGGSAEIGYALTAFGRSAVLDLAVPTGGPATTRLDYVCRPDDHPDWLARCPTLVDERSCTPSCTLPPDKEVCILLGPTPTDAQLRADSVFFEGAQLDYGTMPIHFLYGTRDCGPNVPSSRNWADAVTSERTIEFVDMPHVLISSQEGVDSIVRVMSAECSPKI